MLFKCLQAWQRYINYYIVIKMVQIIKWIIKVWFHYNNYYLFYDITSVVLKPEPGSGCGGAGKTLKYAAVESVSNVDKEKVTYTVAQQ